MSASHSLQITRGSSTLGPRFSTLPTPSCPPIWPIELISGLIPGAKVHGVRRNPFSSSFIANTGPESGIGPEGLRDYLRQADKICCDAFGSPCHGAIARSGSATFVVGPCSHTVQLCVLYVWTISQVGELLDAVAIGCQPTLPWKDSQDVFPTKGVPFPRPASLTFMFLERAVGRGRGPWNFSLGMKRGAAAGSRDNAGRTPLSRA
jgi:hypothetical protein